MVAEKPSRVRPFPNVPRRVRLLVLTQVLNTLAFGYFLIYLTSYLVEINVFNASFVGILLGLESAIVIVIGIPLGVLSDRRERKWILILGSALLPPTLLMFALSRDASVYLVGAVLAGVAEAATLGSWNSIIADQTDLANRDAAFSMSFIVSNVCMSAGMAFPLAIPSLNAATGVGTDALHSGALAVMGGASLIVPFMVWLLLKDYHEKPKVKQAGGGASDLSLLLKFSGMNGIIGLGAGLIIPLMGTWLLYKFSVPDTYSGPFLALSGTTIAFAAFVSPKLSKRFGLFRSILMTAGSSTFFMFSLAFIPNVYLAGGVYIVRSSLMNMASPLMDSYLMGIIDPRNRGLASAIAAIVWRLPNSVSTVVGGLILEAGFSTGNQFYYGLPWLAASLLYVLGIGLVYTNFRNVKPKG